jgi:hypothetical protein
MVSKEYIKKIDKVNIGKKISRKEALIITSKILTSAEQKRIKNSEHEASHYSELEYNGKVKY